MYHWKVSLTWHTENHPVYFFHSLEVWLYAPHSNESWHTLRILHAAYPRQAQLIFERFKNKIQKLRKTEEAYDICLDIEYYDTVHFRRLGGERLRFTEDAAKWFLKTLKHALENIAGQLQEVCWELTASRDREVLINA